MACEMRCNSANYFIHTRTMKDTNTQKTNKSGYEIRLEVLQRALDMADNHWNMSNEAGRLEAESKVKLGLVASWKIVPDNRVEEAMQIAEKLYKFVEAK